MLNALVSGSDFVIFMLISFLFISVSMLIVILSRRFYTQLDYRDNEVIGNISSLIGIIYGVLAGLTALYLINNISYTEEAVQREADAVANIYRDSRWLTEPTKTEVQNELKKYLTNVIHIEWPLMKSGERLSNGGNLIIEHIADHIFSYSPKNTAEGIILADMLDEVKMLNNSRSQRIHMSISALNGAMWTVIFIGTFLTLAINFFFKVHFKLHLVSIAATALMASSMIFLLVTLDRPFRGEFVVETDAFDAVEDYIALNLNQPLTHPEVSNGKAAGETAKFKMSPAVPRGIRKPALH